MAQEGNVSAKVEAVFAAVARGDAGDTDALLALGDAIVPAVSGYLSSGDENVRTEAVALLAALQSEVAATALLPALADPSAAIRERAARAVLAQVLRAGEFTGLDAAAAKGLAAGEPSAAALLLGAFSEGAEDILRRASTSTRLVKLANSDLPVPASLPAQVALSHLGDSSARSALNERIARGEVAELLFLLDVAGASRRSIDHPCSGRQNAQRRASGRRRCAGWRRAVASRRRPCSRGARETAEAEGVLRP